MIDDQSRRSVLKGLSLSVASTVGSSAAATADIGPATPARRMASALQLRIAAARHQLAGTRSVNPVHDIERGEAHRFFCKGLPHDENGRVLPNSYDALNDMLANQDRTAAWLVYGKQGRPLNNPLSGHGFALAGSDPQSLYIPPPSNFESDETAGDMIELYWMSLLRDVPFSEYQESELVGAAVKELTALGRVPSRLPASAPLAWQYLDAGSGLAGPTVSQFLLLNIPYGPSNIAQTYPCSTPGQTFLDTISEMLKIQSGNIPDRKTRFLDAPRYLISGRDLAEYVRRDFTYQPFLNAALIIMASGDSAFSDNDLSRRRAGYANDILFGDKSVLSLLGEVSLTAQKAAFFLKWQCFRRLRPEELGLRVAMHRQGLANFKLPKVLLDSQGVARAEEKYGRALLVQAYPEGSPLHPSYPAAHAVNAGACGTILKAFFDSEHVIRTPVKPSINGHMLMPYNDTALIVADEIDKLIINISVARSFAGVHFRSDNLSGIVLGEQIAISFLQDYARTIPRRFSGFMLRTFDGRQLKVTSSEIIHQK
ncbi:MAG: phosphoesterase [Pseudomonadota bacterium]